MPAQLARVIQVLIYIFTLTHATLITVDDSDTTHWRYSGSWVAIPSQSCAVLCWIQPDPSKTFNSTHHQTTDPQAYAEFTFTGTALEVYVICPANLPGAGHYLTNFTFTLDSVADSSFQGPQPYCDGFMYNLLAYARHNLPSEPHIFRIINTPNIDRVNNLETAIVLDYAVYDGVSQPTSSTGTTIELSTSDKIAIGVGIGIGIPSLLAAIAGAYFGWRAIQGRRAGDGKSARY